MKQELKYKKLKENAIVPTYAHDGDSGMDLFSVSIVTIDANSCNLASTGIALEIPYGYEGQIRSKSGLAFKKGVFVLNSPGTIDSTYRGELKVILYNTTDKVLCLEKGSKIAQLVICPVEYVSLKEDEINETKRGTEGFGSTGETSKVNSNK